MSTYTFEIVTSDRITASDLREELARPHQHIECAIAIIDDKAEHAQVVVLQDYNRAGIAWGADAQWTDATSIEDALDRYTTDTMIA